MAAKETAMLATVFHSSAAMILQIVFGVILGMGCAGCFGVLSAAVIGTSRLQNRSLSYVVYLCVIFLNLFLVYGMVVIAKATQNQLFMFVAVATMFIVLFVVNKYEIDKAK